MCLTVGSYNTAGNMHSDSEAVREETGWFWAYSESRDNWTHHLNHKCKFMSVKIIKVPNLI